MKRHLTLPLPLLLVLWSLGWQVSVGLAGEDPSTHHTVEVEPGLRIFGRRLHRIVEGAGRAVGLDPEGDEDLVGDVVAGVCQKL
jgi:hypothetical protein